VIRFITGVDWSGDAGDPALAIRDNQWLVFVACHVEKDGLEDFVESLERIKVTLGLPQSHTFKHVRSREAMRGHFFRALRDTSVRFDVLAIDKLKWTPGYLGRTSGRERVLDAVCDLFAVCPDEVIAHQILVIDAHRSETRFVREVGARLRIIQRLRESASFKKISAVPDHRHDAVLIQAADMMAGEVRRLGGHVPEVCRGRVRLYQEAH
jgi:hypothetical protein